MDVKNVLIAAGVLYLVLPKAAAAAANRVAWDFDKVRIPGDIHLAQGGFDLRLRITNNLPTDISFETYKGEISQFGKLLGTIDTKKSISLPSGQPVIVESFVRVKGLDLLKALAAGSSALLEPVVIDSYVGFNVAGEIIELPVSNSITLFYVS